MRSFYSGASRRIAAISLSYGLAAFILVVLGRHQLWGQSPASFRQPGTSSASSSEHEPPVLAEVDATSQGSQEFSPTEESPPNVGWDQNLVNQGQIAFESRCTLCHEANKSLGINRSLSKWRSTVKRMAAQDGAEIPAHEWESIAVFLASRSLENSPPVAGESPSDQDEPAFRVFGTISPTFRSGGENVQNQGFFPDAWLGLNWQSKGALSAKVTACATCHDDQDGGFSTPVDLVQASVRLDLGMLVRQSGACPALDQVDSSVEAGRFVVPFGAFASQVNPGVYRTVSRPLIFNMGQRVLNENLGDPVLPMPYSDEGADFNVSIPLFADVSAGMDGYIVQGLQGDGSGINFNNSRNYTDNNRSPAIGGRWTVGNSMLKLGSSLMAGRFNEQGGTGPLAQGMNYTLMGADATFRYKNRFRVQAEYAQRNTESFIDLPGRPFGTDRVGGGYLESELWLFDELSLLFRWDTQQQHYAALASGSTLPSARFGVQRWTYGLNWAITGNSLLMFNIEHWKTPQGLPDINVVGLHWALSF